VKFKPVFIKNNDQNKYMTDHGHEQIVLID